MSKHRSSGKRWTTNEDKILKQNSNLSYGDLMFYFPDRTMKSVQMRWSIILQGMPENIRKTIKQRPQTKGILKTCQNYTGRECMELLKMEEEKQGTQLALNTAPTEPKEVAKVVKKSSKPSNKTHKARRVSILWGLIDIRF